MLHKGLSTGERSRVLIALREDTLVQGTGNLPAGPDRTGAPTDGNTVKWWKSAELSGAHFYARGGSPTYDSSKSGVSFTESGGEYFECWQNLSFRDIQYWRPIFESFTFASRFTFDGSVGSGDNDEVIFTTHDGGTNPGLFVGLRNSGSGPFIYANLRDGSGFVWDTSDTPDTSISLSGTNELHIEQDATGGTNKVSVVFNETEIFFTSGFSLPSSTDVSYQPRLGDSTQGEHIDMTLQGVLLDKRANRGENAIEWIKGGTYHF